MRTLHAAGLRPRPLGTRDLADLTAPPASTPCVSLLMPTRPGPRMSAADRVRLRALVDDADRQLLTRDAGRRARLMARVNELVTQAVDQPTDRGLAIFVNQELARAYRLPMDVTARAVVEPTFATRPLFTVLHRMPPYVLLVLHPTCAHLYQGGDGGLRAVGDRDVFRGSGAVRLPRQSEPGNGGAERGEVTDGFLQGVDALLGAYRSEHPSPLVLAGLPALVDRFSAVSRNLHRLAGRVPPSQDTTAMDLATASSEVVVRYLASRRDEALARLRGALASRPADVARGMSDCWEAAHHSPPGLLLVEEGYVRPGSTSDVVPPTDPDRTPRRVQVHDLVDDLMEVVILRGGQLALVEDGDLDAHGRVALISGFADQPLSPGPGRPPR